MKSVRWFLLIGALGAVGTFTACEKQPASKLEAMTAHHHHEEHAHDDSKTESHATPAHEAHGAPSATPGGH